MIPSSPAPQVSSDTSLFEPVMSEQMSNSTNAKSLSSLEMDWDDRVFATMEVKHRLPGSRKASRKMPSSVKPFGGMHRSVAPWRSKLAQGPPSMLTALFATQSESAAMEPEAGLQNFVVPSDNAPESKMGVSLRTTGSPSYRKTLT